MALVLIVVAATAFGLGRRSVVAEPTAVGSPDIKLIASSTLSDSTVPASGNNSVKTRFVASKNGTKYYLTTCASANRIADKNKVYFASVALAQTAGYTAAKNCPGLQ